MRDHCSTSYQQSLHGGGNEPHHLHIMRVAWLPLINARATNCTWDEAHWIGVPPTRLQHMGENEARPQSTRLSAGQLIIISRFQITL